jgi:hypothetical protein
MGNYKQKLYFIIQRSNNVSVKYVLWKHERDWLNAWYKEMADWEVIRDAAHTDRRA